MAKNLRARKESSITRVGVVIVLKGGSITCTFTIGFMATAGTGTIMRGTRAFAGATGALMFMLNKAGTRTKVTLAIK